MAATTTSAAAAAVPVVIAPAGGRIPIAVVPVAGAALVVVMMVALLLALQADVGHDHLGVVSHSVVITAAPVDSHGLLSFLFIDFSIRIFTCRGSRGIAAYCRADCRGIGSCWADRGSPCGAGRCASCSSRRTRADFPKLGGSI